MLHCPKCNRIIVDTTNEGGAKVRTRMLVFSADGTAHALCPTCKTQVDVPLAIDMNKLPSTIKPMHVVHG